MSVVLFSKRPTNVTGLLVTQDKKKHVYFLLHQSLKTQHHVTSLK